MSLLRPGIKIPLWAAVGLPAAAYLVRSIARGFDFRPDFPGDILAAGLFAVCLIVIGTVRRHTVPPDEPDDGTDHEMDREHRGTRESR